MKHFAKLSSLLIVLLVSISLPAQQFVSVLKKLNTEYRQEKLYLHFDRNVYYAGETIWFKAYLFAGHYPSLISKTLYAELLDQKGKLLRRLTLPIVLSSAAGAIDIPDTIKDAVVIRAYTAWMLNFDSSFLYSKAFPIADFKKAVDVNRVAQPNQSSFITAPLTSLHFFPEGGDLVEGVLSRVAFKSTVSQGMPADVSGEILDDKEKSVATFKSIHDGMGTFMLRPQQGKTYKAVWIEGGRKHKTILPLAKKNGVVLQAKNQGKQIDFTVVRGASSSYPFVYVIAQMNQQLFYRGKAALGQDTFVTGTIPLATVPAGIVQLTVFTPDEQPLAERIVFCKPSGFNFHTSLALLPAATLKRGKNVIEIEVTDTVPCNLSLAVTDAGLDPMPTSDNIYSGLLLTSEIKGYVNNPAYYFSNDADSVTEHLDLLMLTNGWRRFRWEQVLAGQFPSLRHLPENDIVVQGHVEGPDEKLLAGREINGVMEFKNKGKVFLNIPLQPNGSFFVSGLQFFDTAKVFYSFNKDVKNALGAKTHFESKTNLLEEPLHWPPDSTLFVFMTPTVHTALGLRDSLNGRQRKETERIRTLKPVVVTAKKKSRRELMDEKYTSGFFSTDPSLHSRVILPEDDPAFLASPDLFSFLKERIAGLQISVNGTEASVTWRGFQTSLFVNEIPQTALLFDPPGKIGEDPSYILSLPMSEIAMVKIFAPPFFGSGSSSSGGQGGAIAVYLKRPEERNSTSSQKPFNSLLGYSPVKEFYSPDYSLPFQSKASDTRPTLYWLPYVITDKQHRKIQVSFFNSDVAKKIKVIIEGCNEDGKLTREEKVISLTVSQ